MRVVLLAHTRIAEAPDQYAVEEWMGTFNDQTLYEGDSDLLAEFAGRACYESWNKPNPATATNNGYLANILAQQHFSVLEHASATFYILGVSRSLTHELVRHRHLSFSQRSQRYVDESMSDVVVPPAVREHPKHIRDILLHQATQSRYAYETMVMHLVNAGLSRKEARQAARSVLPNATSTNIVVTGNMRAWREVIAKRNHPAADAEIQELAKAILLILRVIAPNTFQDMQVV